MNPNQESDQLRALALKMAQAQVGQSEEPKGSNSGRMVNEYLRSVGLPPGNAWCQAFVYWCYAEAARCLKLLNPVAHSGSVAECWHKAPQKLLVGVARQNPTIIKPGWQFILLFANNTGHTGIIERVEAAGAETILHTIEGNSNNDGSRDGYAVVRHTRKLTEKSLAGLIQYQ
jgi:hypothetical protein